MKRILVTVVFLSLLSTAFAAQNSDANAPAKPKPKVDCATVNDGKITEDVRSRLAAAKSLADLTINVATSGGVVTLTGVAKKPTQKGTATRVARAVPCVKKVDNQLAVEGASAKPKAGSK